MRSLDIQVSSAVAVAIDIGDGMCLELVGVRFNPLRGAEQSRLLAIPCGVDDRPLRPPSLLVQRAQRAGLLELCAKPRNWILGSIYPGTVGVPANARLSRLS